MRNYYYYYYFPCKRERDSSITNALLAHFLDYNSIPVPYDILTFTPTSLLPKTMGSCQTDTMTTGIFCEKREDLIDKGPKAPPQLPGHPLPPHTRAPTPAQDTGP